ncbi:phage portal protein [Bacteroides thetaiotaomicron]|uniref:phage portal protein n=1 Tax=Bacteroides thetaiotaomicron TaxID=818 RepID=UPI0039C2B320
MNFNIFKRNKHKEERALTGYYSDALNFNNYSSFSANYAMRLSAVYRAVELISDSVAMLPIYVQFIDNDGYKTRYNEHSTNKLLNEQPNKLMTRYQFIKLLMIDVMLKGNGFAYIRRDDIGNCIELVYLSPDTVTIDYNELTRELKYRCNTVTGIIEPCNMIHLVKYSADGVHGISILQNAKNTLALTSDTEKQASNFFKSGCALSGILKVQGQLSDAQKQQIKSSWNSTYNGENSGLAVIQGNMDYQQIAVNAADAQLLESRLFNITDIARFFGLSPVLLGDLSKSSYSTLEQSQLQFLSQTLQPYISMIEQEFSRKIFRPSELNLSVNIDEKALIMTDKAALSAYYVQLLQNGIMSANEIRKELGLPAIEGGDKTVMQAQYLQQQNNNMVNTDVENDTENL